MTVRLARPERPGGRDSSDVTYGRGLRCPVIAVPTMMRVLAQGALT